MPINLPDYAFIQSGVDPDLGIASARSEGGLIITSRRADPFWAGPMTTRPLFAHGPRNEHADFRAFLSRCVDENLRVDFVHPRHRFPHAYDAASWPMAGNAELVSVPNLRTIVLRDLVEGMTLQRGDRLSIVQGDIVCHRWVAADLTVTSAITQVVEVTPRLPIGVVAAGATVLLKNPKMRFMIVPGTWDDKEVAEASPISFEIMEALR
ncbi:hypothetical protein [Paradevosia shaoguanensis]|uniref:hypothetical protein n=1 Tax=Paradevosia shaoguanensis TaxID=1335043 RepID=UPI00193297DA|nr:hypothetical protein [Paradevosia shaoguanensis]